MTPLYHGITIRDAADMCGVTESTVRSWLHRGKLVRTGDGQICPFSLQEWWDYHRNTRMDEVRRGIPAVV